MWDAELQSEEQRLRAVERYAILDTDDEESFDRITRLAASLFAAPVALISIVDRERIWVKSKVGHAARQMPLQDSFSVWTILSDEVLVIHSISADPRFQAFSAEARSYQFEFYAGAPLITPEGVAIGSLSIIDHRPRNEFSEEDASHLANLAGLVIDQMELRRKTLQLSKSEADYRDLFQHCPIGIYRTSPEGEILMVNPAILNMLGYPSLEALQQVNLEANEVVGRRSQWKQELEARGMISSHESVWYTRSGLPLQICETTRVVRRADGSVAYYEGWAEDISLQKSAEDERKKALQVNQKLIEAVPDLIYILDFKKERAVFTNRSYFAVVGQDPEYVRTLANPMDELVHAEDVGRLREHRERFRYAQDGEFFELEYRVLDHTGRYRTLCCRETIFSRAPDGAPRELLGIVQNISDRRAMEEQLQRDEERWQLVLAANNDGLWDWDAKSGKTFHSPRWREMLGYDGAGEEAVPSWESLLHPEDTAHVQARLASYLRRDSSAYQEEYRLRAKDGRYRWVFARGVGQWDQQGNLLRMVGAHSDITDRKETELALRLQAIELAEARDNAESAARAKSSFLATMSHEIRTPLNGIIGMTAILADTELTMEQQDYLRTIRSSGTALLTVINDILDFSKIEAGYMELDSSEFHLAALVEESLELVAEQADRKGVELAASIEDAVPTMVYGDSGRLRQVLLNLLSNAVKFTHHGEVVLSVSAHETEAGMLRFAVTDTGIGIPKEVRERIFSAFSQADASTTRRFGGTGLGLAISKQLVELMGGEIGVTSREGSGSTFWFHARLPAAPSATTRLAPCELAGARVLVVDDNATNTRIIRHLLESVGVEVCCAGGGREALQVLTKANRDGVRFDLALLDFQMPEMDGLTLANAIREREDLQRLPIVLLTSVTHRDHGKAAGRGDIQAYLVKPIRQQLLLQTMRDVLAKAPRADLRASGARLSLQSDTPTRNGRILLAEDNLVNQKVGLLLLTRLGYEVDVVSNGLEAVEACQRVAYHAVLLDCQMPEMDGFEATRRIREMEGSIRHTSIIALTANALAGERERCLRAGMDDYLSKPINQKLLQEKLAAFVQPVSA